MSDPGISVNFNCMLIMIWFRFLLALLTAGKSVSLRSASTSSRIRSGHGVSSNNNLQSRLNNSGMI
jgi:hypothetical protein